MRSLPDHLWVVILAGGIGSRFWPASTPRRPKQLLPLASDQPLIKDTVERILPLVPLERIRILTGAGLADPLRRAVPGLEAINFLLEPRAAGTAPALAWAAAELVRIDPDAIMVSLHADHLIAPPEVFREQIVEAASLARSHRRLMTIGAKPTRPETGYGYIRVGDPLPALPELPAVRAFEVSRFVEKPDESTAVRYLHEGNYLWNTGLFVWTVRDLLEQLQRHTPEVAPLIPSLLNGDPFAFFERVPTLSIDEGLLERSPEVAVLPSRFEWDDIGAWDALYRTHPVDQDGNVIIGDGVAIDSSGTAIYSDGGPVVAFGVENLVVVRTPAVTFITTREKTADLKRLIAVLPERLRDPRDE